MPFNSSSSLYVEFTRHRFSFSHRFFCILDTVYQGKWYSLFSISSYNSETFLDFGENSVLQSMLWCLVTGMRRNTKHSSSVNIHIIKCGFAWHYWRKSPHDVAQYCSVDPRNWSIVRADFLLREVVKKRIWRNRQYAADSSSILRSLATCSGNFSCVFGSWSSWRSPTTGIMFKSSYRALNHLKQSKTCVRDTASFL